MPSVPLTAYRTAPARPDDTTPVVVPCASCGFSARVAGGKESFRCASCDVEQPTLRRDVAWDAPLRATMYAPASYEQLSAFGASVGVEKPAALITLRVDGVDVAVSVNTNSGSPTSIAITVDTLGLPDLMLRRELREDVDAKDAGVAVEHQTGDPELDGLVYIASEGKPDDAAIMMSSPAVRAAAIKLVSLGHSVRVTPTSVCATCGLERSNLAPEALRTASLAVRVLAGAPRSTEVTPARIHRDVVLGLVFGASVIVSSLAVAYGGSQYVPVTATPVLLGLAIGGIAALLAWPLWSRLLRGRATSTREIRLARGGTLVVLPVAAAGAMMLINGVCDRSRETTHDLACTAMHYDSDDDALVHVDGASRDASVGERSYVFVDSKKDVKLPCTMQVGWREGALGYRWQSSPAKLYAGGLVYAEH